MCEKFNNWYSLQVSKQLDENLHNIDVPLNLLLLKPIHVEQLGELSNQMTTVSLKEIIHIDWKTAGISDCLNNGVYGLELFDVFHKIIPMMEQSEKPWDYNTNRNKRTKCKKIPFIYIIYTYINKYIYIYIYIPE